jgi:pristinamycin I synthase-3/4
VQLNLAEPLITMMARLQDQQSTLTIHQHLGLTHIQHLAGIHNLFDTVVGFQNYPWDSPGDTVVRITLATGRDATHYPLTLRVSPAPRLQLRLEYRGDLFERASIEAFAVRPPTQIRLSGGSISF